eukprot:CAMPEP_0170731816 /NCGR_PEP_ID=MMETSP0437-20130122/1238_1 /TAXON_ID=0 /ORGANISM="Sexangularia sp." /LENGTH=513 /DNA_ID=CAMNT_0011070047 /DNA_START=72 /DNA_END=1613 /DNA_ORIENTATION=-
MFLCILIAFVYLDYSDLKENRGILALLVMMSFIFFTLPLIQWRQAAAMRAAKFAIVDLRPARVSRFALLNAEAALIFVTTILIFLVVEYSTLSNLHCDLRSTCGSPSDALHFDCRSVPSSLILYEECTGVNLKLAKESILDNMENDTMSLKNHTIWINELFDPTNSTPSAALVAPGLLDAEAAAEMIIGCTYTVIPDESPTCDYPSLSDRVEYTVDHPTTTFDVFSCSLIQEGVFLFIVMLLFLLTCLAVASIVAISNRPNTERISTLRQLEVSNSESAFLIRVSYLVGISQTLVAELLFFIYDFTSPSDPLCKPNPHSFALQAFAYYAILHAALFGIAIMQAAGLLSARVFATQLLSVANGANLFTVKHGTPILARPKSKGSFQLRCLCAPCACVLRGLGSFFNTATRSSEAKEDEEVGFLFEGAFWSKPIEELEGVSTSLTTVEYLYADLDLLMSMTYETYCRYERTFETNESVSLAMFRDLDGERSPDGKANSNRMEASEDEKGPEQNQT